jgi:hypothetical protein
MAGHTMYASTFLNAVQTDYAEFRRETLEMISYVRQHQVAAKPDKQAHAAAH